MSTLSAERCVACHRDLPRVTEAEIAELRRELSGWQLLERDGIARLERVFHFPSFADALAFTNRVGASPRRRVTIPPSSPSGGVSR
jgi:4a-hydroxytetrahydrobiopterin dehydratase